jgi:hypothetical protein
MEEDQNNVYPFNTTVAAGSDITVTTTDSGTVNTNLLTTTNTPYWSYTYPHTYSTSSWITIDKAENGFIIRKGYQTFIAKTPEEVLKYLVEDKKGKR